MKLTTKTITSFGQQILMPHLNSVPLSQYLAEFKQEANLTDLWPAWLPLNNKNEENYLQKLLLAERSCTLPILLCPDDLDFSCTTVVAQIEFKDQAVYWKKIGLVNFKAWDLNAWQRAGLYNQRNWHEKEWLDFYDLYSLSEKSAAWVKVFVDNWPHEETLRLENYYHDFINNPENIDWFNLPEIKFDLLAYRLCLANFR